MLRGNNNYFDYAFALGNKFHVKKIKLVSGTCRLRDDLLRGLQHDYHETHGPGLAIPRPPSAENIQRHGLRFPMFPAA
jgi:hypothetical protein